MAWLLYDLTFLAVQWGKLPLPPSEITWTPRETKPIHLLPNWGPNFYVYLEIQIKNFPRAELTNIVHFTTGDMTDMKMKYFHFSVAPFIGLKDCCEVGQRIPAIYLHRDRHFVIAISVGEEGNMLIKTRKFQLQRRRKYSLSINQQTVEGKAIINHYN